MSLLGKSAESIAVIDIRSSSIGAAYVVLEKDNAPSVIHSVRLPLEAHATEPVSEALPRTLESALHQLVSEGAPLLRAAASGGNVDKVFVAVAAPWQNSRVFSRVIERDKPFVFTQHDLNESTKEDKQMDETKTRVSEMIIATMLNGYEVSNPFGKKVNRAELIMLSSSIDSALMEMVEKVVRKSLHQHHIEFDAFLPEAYAVLRDLYPHQRDFIVLDIGSDATEVLLVKHGMLISMMDIAHGVAELSEAARGVGLSSPVIPTAPSDAPSMIDISRNTNFGTKIEGAKTVWLTNMKASLGELAKQEPLPRTVFLLAEENVRDFLRNLLDAPELRALWLSDESLSILPVLGAQFASFVTSPVEVALDPAIALLALAARKRF